MSRLIPKELIPSTLWDNEESLMYLPPQLISGWMILLEKNGLLDKAKTRAPEGFQGGKSKEDTDNHFAWRFSGSCARVMLSMLDPHQDLNEIPDFFAKFFSGNRILLADLPCGSGAASLSILSVYYELRKQGLVPREPLEVLIVGGELSEFAQSYAREGLTLLKEELEKQAIFIEHEIMNWDVCDRFSNAELINCLTLKGQGCSARVLVLANFSGFLQRENKWVVANQQIDELFRFNRGESSMALWIEPNRNDVTKSGGFIQRLLNWFTGKFSSILSTDAKYRESSANVRHPLANEVFRTNLAIVRFDLPLRK
jgi:hypothetical protein